MISYLLHRLFVDTYTVDMNGAAITITYYNEAPLTKVKQKNKKTCEHLSGEKEIIFHGHLLELYFLINSIKNIKAKNENASEEILLHHTEQTLDSLYENKIEQIALQLKQSTMLSLLAPQN